MRTNRFPSDEEYVGEDGYVREEDYVRTDDVAVLRDQLEAAERDGAEIATRAQEEIDFLNNEIERLKQSQTPAPPEPISKICRGCVEKRRILGFLATWFLTWLLYDKFHLWGRVSTMGKWISFIFVIWPMLSVWAKEALDRIED